MNEALLIIDYSYDFVAADGKLTAGEPAQAIEDALYTKACRFLEEGKSIIFVMDLHEEADPFHPESQLFPPHNIKDSPGRALYGRLQDFYMEHKDSKQIVWIDKVRYSAFYGTTLDSYLRSRDIKKLVLTGVCTDICVLHTAVDAYNLSYSIEVPESCVASFNEAAHTVALQHFKNSLGARISD